MHILFISPLWFSIILQDPLNQKTLPNFARALLQTQRVIMRPGLTILSWAKLGPPIVMYYINNSIGHVFYIISEKSA